MKATDGRNLIENLNATPHTAPKRLSHTNLWRGEAKSSRKVKNFFIFAARENAVVAAVQQNDNFDTTTSAPSRPINFGHVSADLIISATYRPPRHKKLI
jgi:hypothetical protein